MHLVTTSGTCGNNFTGNIGEASSTGFEVELAAALSENLTLNANLGIVDAQFDQTVLVPGSTIDIVRKGDKLPDVPETTYNISLDYSIPRDSGEYYVVANLNYVDETLELPGRPNDDITGNGIDSGNVRPDYTVVDLRIGYISENGWEAAVFAENLFDEEAIYGFNDAIAFAFPVSDPTVRNRPRTIGVSLMYPFN
jgi:iron complex outermembrane receptor protein